MPAFKNTLIGVGPICDADCTVVLKKKDVTVLSPKGEPILQGWREEKLPRLWRVALSSNKKQKEPYTTTSQNRPEASNVYDLPSMEALVRYMHTAAGFPVRSTWLKTIKNGNFNSWPGLTYNNAAKYCPQSLETMKGHMVQYSREVISTKRMDKKYITIKWKKCNNQTQKIVCQLKKHKKFTYGIIL